MIIFLGLLLLFAAAVVATWSMLPDETLRTIRRRIFKEVAVERRPSWISVLSDYLAPIHRLLPLGWYNAHIWRVLSEAGMTMHPLHFLVVQEIGAVSGIIIYLATVGLSLENIMWLGLFVFAGFMVPYLWLGNKIKARRFSITKDMPAVVDLLSLCVGAGSDFLSALSRIVREFRPCPLREEFAVVLQEIRVGKRRRDALRAFAQRVKTPEAQSFARTLIQADRMGTGLTEALLVLSEDIRIARYHWAERFAQQAPLKMLLPLMMSLASALIVVGAPILVTFMRGGFMAPKLGEQENKKSAQSVPAIPRLR